MKRPACRIERARICALVTIAIVASARTADAKSCIDHAYEHMDLTLDAVYRGLRKVAAPPELEPLDEAMNSGDQGAGILMWNKADMGFAKFYKLATPRAAAPVVQAYLDNSSDRSLVTGCGYTVRYTPILPGTYRFHEEHTDGAKVSTGIDRPALVVSPGRDQLELRFAVKGIDYRAVYRVTCAYFEWGKREPCAPMAPGAISPALGEAPQLDSSNVTVTRPPEMPPAQPATRGCRGCTTTGHELAPLLLLLLLGVRRRN